MNSRIHNKPVKRSKLRLYLGKRYFILKRHVKWYLHDGNYSKHFSDSQLPYLVFEHKTPLIRKLQGVDINLQYFAVDMALNCT